jgi:hypothetical protein
MENYKLIKLYMIHSQDDADVFCEFNKNEYDDKRDWLLSNGAYVIYINIYNIIGLLPHYGEIYDVPFSRLQLNANFGDTNDIYVYGNINYIAKRINKALNKKEDL